MSERWEVIFAEYLEIQDEGASSEERRNRPKVCLADASQRIAEFEERVRELEAELDRIDDQGGDYKGYSELAVENARLWAVVGAARTYMDDAVHSAECCAHEPVSQCICGIAALDEALAKLDGGAP